MELLHLLGALPGQLWNNARLKPFVWLDEERGLAACRYPRDEAGLRRLVGHGVEVLVNLHERPHSTEQLARFGLAQVHLPVRDFTAPTPEQLSRGVEAIEAALAEGRRVAVHCGAGLGRTGTLLACYLVTRGLTAEAAIQQVRLARPGSVETRAQEAAVRAYARSMRVGNVPAG